MYYLDIALNQASEPQHAEPPVPSAGTAASKVEQLATPVFDKSVCLLWGRSAGLAVVLAGASSVPPLSVWGHGGVEERPALCSRFSCRLMRITAHRPAVSNKPTRKTSTEQRSPSLFHCVRILRSELTTILESPLWVVFFLCVKLTIITPSTAKRAKICFALKDAKKQKKTPTASLSHHSFPRQIRLRSISFIKPWLMRTRRAIWSGKTK